MNEENTMETTDPMLEAWFAEAAMQEPDEQFTESVMSRTRKFKWRVLGIAAVVLAALVVAFLGAFLVFPAAVTEGALMIIGFVTLPVLSLGEGWLAWVLTPINTVGALLVAVVKLLRVVSRKALGASYVS